MLTARTSLRRAQGRRLVLRVASRAVDLVKKLMMAKKLTCLRTWRMMKMTSMRMK